MAESTRSSDQTPRQPGNQTPASDNQESLPGDLNYPPGEDIMNPANGYEKMADTDNLTRSGKYVERTRSGNISNESQQESYDDLGIVPGTEADVTAEDLLVLGSLDGGQRDDDLVRGKNTGMDRTGEELDIPGAELDDENEALGEEDEENNYYSLGGDNHENLEESQA